MKTDPTRIDLHTDPLTRRMTGVSMHGLVPFDVPFMSEIAPNLWQGGCANGLVLPPVIQHVVSLYPWESYAVRHQPASAVSVMMLDSTDQDTSAILALAGWVNACRKSGPVLVHCQAGLNRSSLVVASALMLEGATADAAISLIREGRSPACLCNPAFEDWLRGGTEPDPVLPEDDLLLPGEAAAVFGVQTPQLIRWEKAGHFPEGAVTRTPGNHRRYRASVIYAMREAAELEAAP